MTLDTENNPCCRKKGTLVITIEPCTKGRETVPEMPRSYYGEKYIPGLPHKTPRTMEIEVKIKGKDQELFSEEEFSREPSIEKYIEETELLTHSPSGEEEGSSKESSSEPIKSEELEPTISCKTIPLEKKPCSVTCPGPLICLPKKHFLGDRCKLHDPTAIGNQILLMHRNGLLSKRLYNPENIYPDHILAAISEINKKHLEKAIEDRKKTSPGDEGDVIEPDVVKKKVDPLEAHKDDAKSITSARQSTKDDQVKRNRSGCYC